MPDIKEKLVELIHHCTSCEECFDADIADYLIANGVTIQKWISVEERLPEGSSVVLIYDNEGRVGCTYYHYSLLCSKTSEWQRVTHWMPLPEPPNL